MGFFNKEITHDLVYLNMQIELIPPMHVLGKQ